jgi:hypothetical protein
MHPAATAAARTCRWSSQVDGGHRCRARPVQRVDAGVDRRDQRPGRGDEREHAAGGAAREGRQASRVGGHHPHPDAIDADLPTVAETLPGYETVAWFGVLAPAGTPKDVVNRLSAEIGRIARSPEMRERLAGMGAEPSAARRRNSAR